MNSINNLLISWLAAFPFIELFYNSLFYTIGTGTTAEYYRKTPTYVVVFGDLSYFSVVFLIAVYIFKYYNKVYPSLRVWKEFLIVLILTQWVIDFIWAVVVNVTKTKNRYINFFKRYIAEVGIKGLIIYSIYLCLWSLMALYIMENFDILWQYVSIFFGIFLFVVFSFS